MRAKLLNLDSPELAVALRAGAVGILPTDTLYGLVASAYNPGAVERVYDLKGRDQNKPCIILADDPQRVLDFGVMPRELAVVRHLWPAPLSVVFASFGSDFAYLRREGKNPPFRVPANLELQTLLAASGPLIAPSANKQGQPPAATLAEAQAIFGDSIDFYVDGGSLSGQPSTIAAVRGSRLRVVRPGAFALEADHLENR